MCDDLSDDLLPELVENAQVIQIGNVKSELPSILVLWVLVGRYNPTLEQSNLTNPHLLSSDHVAISLIRVG